MNVVDRVDKAPVVLCAPSARDVDVRLRTLFPNARRVLHVSANRVDTPSYIANNVYVALWAL